MQRGSVAATLLRIEAGWVGGSFEEEGAASGGRGKTPLATSCSLGGEHGGAGGRHPCAFDAVKQRVLKLKQLIMIETAKNTAGAVSAEEVLSLC